MPAFVGLGAPYWDAEARGAIFGLTRNSGAAEIARAALEAVGYQTRDLLEAMRADWPAAAGTVLRVDGGMTASDVTMQFLADILGAPVDRPVVLETTALGAAYLAGYQAGVCPDPQGFAKTWGLDAPLRAARWTRPKRARKWAGWRRRRPPRPFRSEPNIRDVEKVRHLSRSIGRSSKAAMHLVSRLMCEGYMPWIRCREDLDSRRIERSRS